MWKSEAAAFGLNDAQAAFRRPLRRYLANSAEPRPEVGLRFEAPSFGPRPAFVLRKSGGASGAIAASIDDISGCGEALLFEGPVAALCARAWILPGMGDFSATLAQEDFTTDLSVIPASPKLRAGREDHLSIAETKMRQCTSGEAFGAQCFGYPRAVGENCITY